MKYRAYPAYKDSGVEWLGEVPEHWKVKAIKWESPVFRGASPRPIDDPIYFDDDDGEYAWVRISDVTASGMYLEITEQKLSALGSSLSVKLDPGALFLSIAGSVGKPCITQIKCCIHDGFVYFPRFKGEARFLYYVFASGEPYRGLGKMGTQLNLNTDTVGSIVVGVPDVEEQSAIADFLDVQTAKIDALLAKKRKLIEKLKEKRTALISRTVTRGLPPEAARAAGLGPHPPMKQSGGDWLGEVPEGWKRTRISSLFRFFSGGTPSTSTDEYWDGNIPWVSAKDMKKILICDTEDHISPLAVKESATMMVPEGSILMVTRSGILKHTLPVAILFKPAAFNQDLKALVPLNSNVLPLYFVYFVTGNQSTLLTLWRQQGATVDSLNLDSIKCGAIVLPPIPEQRAIVDFLDQETSKIDRMIAKAEEAIEHLQEYRTALITAAVTGKINVCNGQSGRNEC